MRRRAVIATVALAGALTVAGGLVAGLQSPARGSRAADGGKTVYVYDSDVRANGFDHNCKGWVWSELGFVDGNGKPAADGVKKGDQIKVGAAVRGSVLSDAGGKANGYASADGTKEAFDLSRGGTLKQAYKRLVVAPVGSRSHAVSTLPVYVHWKGVAVWL